MDGFKKEVVVMSASQYSMTDRETGVVNEGVSVRYCMSDTLSPSADADSHLKGYKLSKANVGFNCFANFTEVPGVYEVDLLMNIRADGSTTVNAANFKFKRPLVVSGK